MLRDVLEGEVVRRKGPEKREHSEGGGGENEQDDSLCHPGPVIPLTDAGVDPRTDAQRAEEEA